MPIGNLAFITTIFFIRFYNEERKKKYSFWVNYGLNMAVFSYIIYILLTDFRSFIRTNKVIKSVN